VGKFSEEPGLWDGVGTIDYLIDTVFDFPIGVVDSKISSYFYWYENQMTLQQEKS